MKTWAEVVRFFGMESDPLPAGLVAGLSLDSQIFKPIGFLLRYRVIRFMVVIIGYRQKHGEQWV